MLCRRRAYITMCFLISSSLTRNYGATVRKNAAWFYKNSQGLFEYWALDIASFSISGSELGLGWRFHSLFSLLKFTFPHCALDFRGRPRRLRRASGESWDNILASVAACKGGEFRLRLFRFCLICLNGGAIKSSLRERSLLFSFLKKLHFVRIKSKKA